MNMQKLTQKSMEVLQTAQSMAVEYGNAQIEQEHIVSIICQSDNHIRIEFLIISLITPNVI